MVSSEVKTSLTGHSPMGDDQKTACTSLRVNSLSD